MAAIEEMDAFVASLLAPTAVIPRHRVSPSASPMTGSSAVSSTLRLLDSIAAISGVPGRPVKPGDDDRECGARLDTVIARSEAIRIWRRK